jgi:hypothetical protein
MTAKEIEAQVKKLPRKELRQFANWWDNYRDSLIVEDAPSRGDSSITEAQRSEILRRRDELLADPSLMVPFSRKDLDKMVKEFAHARAKKTPAR